MITEVPLDVDLSGDRDPRKLISAEFSAQSLAWFDVVDDPLATSNAPSAWSFDDVGQRLQQTSAISGGTSAVNANKPGTYLVLRTTPSIPPVTDFILRSEVESDGDQGLGLVFRFQDPANFYFVLLNANKNYRVLGRKVAGSFQQVALDVTASFTVGAVTRLKVVASGSDLTVFVDDQQALAGADSAARGPARRPHDLPERAGPLLRDRTRRISRERSKWMAETFALDSLVIPGRTSRFGPTR